MSFFISKIKSNLIKGFSRRAGRNFFGRKTIFTQSGGLKFKSRLIDFKRNFVSDMILLSIEKDIKRTAFVGLVCYENGLFTNILLSTVHSLKLNKLISGFSNFGKLGSSSFISCISTGSFVHHIELFPGSGGKICRAAGTIGFILSRDNLFSYLKMKSGWMLKISNYCLAITGVTSNE